MSVAHFNPAQIVLLTQIPGSVLISMARCLRNSATVSMFVARIYIKVGFPNHPHLPRLSSIQVLGRRWTFSFSFLDCIYK